MSDSADALAYALNMVRSAAMVGPYHGSQVDEGCSWAPGAFHRDLTPRPHLSRLPSGLWLCRRRGGHDPAAYCGETPQAAWCGWSGLMVDPPAKIPASFNLLREWRDMVVRIPASADTAAKDAFLSRYFPVPRERAT